MDKSLDPESDEECRFVFYEGEEENFTNPKANHHVGTIVVRSKDLPRKVNKGAEVEITLSIDISRVTNVSALLPDLGIELFTDQGLEGLGAKWSVIQRMSELEKEMDSAEHTLNLLRKKGINMSYSSQKLITFPESWDLMRWQYYSAALPSWFSHWHDSG